MDIYFATTNQRKVQSLQRDLGKYGISVIQQPIELVEPRSSDVRDIAQAKILQAYPLIHKPTIVIDSGFYIDALNGFPRAYVNFSLETIGLEGILKLVEGKPRNCEFRDCLAYMDESLEKPELFLSHVRGKIAIRVQGFMQEHLWSELGLIFIPEGSKKTHAEMTKEEYLEWRKISRENDSPGKKLYDWISANKPHYLKR